MHDVDETIGGVANVLHSRADLEAMTSAPLPLLQIVALLLWHVIVPIETLCVVAIERVHGTTGAIVIQRPEVHHAAFWKQGSVVYAHLVLLIA